MTASLVAAGLAACSKTDAPPEKSCSGAEALSFVTGNNNGFLGDTLAAKQLVLTFDDGPGSQSGALAAYLKTKGIRATFFVNGHCVGADVGDFTQCQQNAAATPADLFAPIVAAGHIVGNHTQDHADLSSTVEFPLGAAGDMAIAKELSDTDTVIAPFVSNGRFLFRAPFGAWSARDYTVLHASPMDKYVGPVKWDIGGAMTGPKNGSDDAAGHYAADWDCWQNADGYGVKTTAQCARRYLREIDARGKGIVLMHDADYGDVANHALTSGKGNTIDMVKLLLEGDAGLGITGLLAKGYTFVRLDEVPAIAAKLPAIPDAGADAAKDAGDSGADPDAGLDASSSSSSSSSSSGGSSGTTPPQSTATPPATPPSSPPDPCAEPPAPVITPSP
jgi:peptidoglycan/xylan/chitin deacetylase (PgdA/CDA1 family)